MNGLGEGYLTTLHYADGLDNEKDRQFRKHFKERYNEIPDVYAVQGYDAAQLLEIGLMAVKGDISKKGAFRDAMRNAEIDSPRGKFTLSPAGNPVQDIYLREVKGGENRYIKVAVKKLADPATGCAL
ncbi:Periplasmic binding protein [compost metagenome]